MGSVHLTKPTPQLWAQNTQQRMLQRLVDGDGETAGAGDGRHLAADEAGTHNLECTALVEDVAESIGLVQFAQIEPVFVSGQEAWPATHDQEQPPVVHSLAARQTDGVKIRLDLDHLFAEPQVRLDLGQKETLRRHLVQEKALGQMGPFVGRVQLSAQHDRVALEASAPQTLHSAVGGNSAADKDNALVGYRGGYERRLSCTNE